MHIFYSKLINNIDNDNSDYNNNNIDIDAGNKSRLVATANAYIINLNPVNYFLPARRTYFTHLHPRLSH